MEMEHGSQATKKRGIRVIRALVTKFSSLNGKMVSEVDFRKSYKAAIVAVQKGGRNVVLSGTVRFGPGDILVLQASDDSPLLKVPPTDFYKRSAMGDASTNNELTKSNSVASFVNLLTRSRSTSLDNTNAQQQRGEIEGGGSRNDSGSDDLEVAKARTDSADGSFVIEIGDSNAADEELANQNNFVDKPGTVRKRNAA